MMATRLLILTMLSSMAAGQTPQQANNLKELIGILSTNLSSMAEALSANNILSGHFVSCVISRGLRPTLNVPCNSKSGTVNDVIVALVPFGYQCPNCTPEQTALVTLFRDTFQQPQYQQECKKLESGLRINGLCL